AQGGYLSSRIGPDLIVRDRASGPLQKAPFACDRDPIGCCDAEALRRLPVRQQRPPKLADHEDRGGLGQSTPRRAPLLTNQRERFLYHITCEPRGAGDS